MLYLGVHICYKKVAVIAEKTTSWQYRFFFHASFLHIQQRGIFLFTEFKFWFSINGSMMELDFGRNLENILKMFRQKADLKIYTGSRQRMKEHCFVVHVYIPDNKKWLVSLQNVNKVKSILLAHALSCVCRLSNMSIC